MTNEAIKALVMIALFGGLRAAILATEIQESQKTFSSVLADWTSLIRPLGLLQHWVWNHLPAPHAVIERK